MAKNTQEAEVLITMNGKAAENALAALRKQQEQCNDAIKAGIEAQKELDKLRSTSIGEYKKVEGRGYKEQEEHLKSIIRKGKEGASTLKRLKEQINVTELATKKYADVLKNINGSSLAELQAVAKQLKFEIRQLPPETQKFIDKTKQLKEVNTRINQITTSFKGLVVEEKTATFSLKGLADGFNKYFGMVTTAIAAVTGMSMAFRKTAEDAAKLDDTYSDVMKTTGLLHDEVAELDKELMKIDTRTSREQLLLLARDAGKLGIQGKEDILGFVRAADQIQVALGEDLGEGAIRNLGKIADVLGLTQSMGIEKSLLSIASAVNAVGQASTASEGYLVDFTQRLAGVAAQTGISASNIIGFASGLDQSAMKVEMASTAFQKFLMKLYEDPAKFAAYANLEVGKFTELLQNDANQAVITILKALKDQDGFASLVPIFKDMGLDGARAVSVLAAMATNIQAVTDAQALANVEFEKATSVTEEYNTKNNNMQAQLEKARKEFQNASIALGQSLNPIMLKSTKATTYLIKALAQYGKEIKTVVITMAALTTAIKLQTIAQKGLNAANKLGQTIQKTGQTIAWAYRVVMMKLTGQTQLATFAQAELNKVMSASVFGLVATAVSALVFGISRLVRNYREAAEAADWEATIEKKVNKEYAEQAGRVKALTAIVENNNIALSERKNALEELRGLVPDYHGDLTKEGKLINSNKEAIDEYCKSLRQMIRLQTHKDELQELEQQIIEKEDELEKARQKQREALIKAGGDTTESYSTLGGLKFTDYGKASGKVRVLEKELESLYVRENQISVKMGELTKGRIDGLTEEQREIEEVRKKYEQLFNDAKNAYVGTPAEGMKALGKLQEQMDEEIAAIKKKYAQVTEETTGGSGSGGNGGGNGGTKTNDLYKQEIDALKRHKQERENLVKELYANNQITKEQYDQKMIELDMEFLKRQVELARQYGQDETAVMSAFLDAQIAANDRAYAEITRQKEEWDAANQKDFERWQKQFEEMQAQAKEIKAQLNPRGARMQQMDDELEQLSKLHDAKLLSEEEYEEAVKQLRKKYAEENLQEQLGNIADYIKLSSAMMEQASNFVTALKEAETAKLEAEYQAQLTAAGDNAEQRETIEAEYEQKKLDLQKQYADADMAINIAKTVANGAAAAVRAFADSGWVAGSIIAAMIAASTAAEVATIVAQRNAIKNTSLNNSGSSNSSGQRVIAGYAGGGYTEDHTTFTTVGEEGTEWIAPHWMVSQNPVTFRNLEQYRRAGSHGRSGSVSRGFAEGGFTDDEILAGKMSGFLTKQEIEAAVETAIVRAMANRAIRAYLVRKDLTELDNQDARLKAITSLG